MQVVSIFAYFLTLFAFLTNVFIYPGFLENRIGISPFYFFGAYIVINLFSILQDFRLSNQKKYLRLFYSLNNKAILPLSFLSSLVFSILEFTRYNNFVYSTINIYYFDLAFVFLVSYLTKVSQNGRRGISKNFRRQLKDFPLVLLFVFWVLTTRSDQFLPNLTKEDGLIEYAQAGFYFLSGAASFLAFNIFRRHGSLFLAISYLLIFVASFFVAFEEISWGQRIFDIETPTSLAEINVQGEITVHNLPFFHSSQRLVYTLIGIYGSFSWILSSIAFVKKNFNKLFSFFTPPKYLFLYFFPVAVYNTIYITVFGNYHPLSEFLELLLAVGIFVFILQNYLKVKSKSFIKSINTSLN